jgi:hypothetical protein
MNVAIDHFLDELAAYPHLAPAARLMTAVFDRLNREGGRNPDALALYQLVTRVVADTDKSLSERLAALSELVDIDGKVLVPRDLLNG